MRNNLTPRRQMRILTTDQLSNEWFSARVGRITASRVGDAMRKLQRASGNKKAGDWHGDHDEIVREIAREMITGIPAWHRVTPEMDYGRAHESEARRAYAEATGTMVGETGFVLHPTFDRAGASPDGLVDEDGALEIKVPLMATHIDNLINDEIPAQYLPQMYMVMLCCERKWIDFVSYCPKDIDDDERLMLPDHLRLFVKRLYADRDKFKEIEEAATATIEEAVALVKKLSSRTGKRVPWENADFTPIVRRDGK